jgi:hypothetical protein
VNRRQASIVLAGLAGLPAARAQKAEAQTYPLERFDIIEISGSATVRFRLGASEQIAVEGLDEAAVRELFEVRNGRLRIHSAGAWRFWEGRKVRVEVTARELARLFISGAADFSMAGPLRSQRLVIGISGAGSARFERVDVDSLTFDVSGSGDGQVAGTARELKVRITGRSEFDAEALRAERGSVSISGVGDVRVWVVRELNIAVAGAGRVQYWGTPEVRRHVSGAATVNERGPKADPP